MHSSRMGSSCMLALVSLLVIASRSLEIDSLSTLGLIGSRFGLLSNATYDYVVVGGGTAGLALATRLAQDTRYTVAVIEAGFFYEFDNGNQTTVPGTGLAGTGNNPSPEIINPSIDWLQYTAPQRALNNLTALYPSGKTFGGGSARNYQAYQRGTIGSYQKWADLVGDQSYTFNSLLPYFKKSVDYHPPVTSLLPANVSVPSSNSSFNVGGGPLQVSYSNWFCAFASWARLAFREIGIPDAHDFVSGSLFGNQYVMATQDPRYQTRSSSETSFLRLGLSTTTGLLVYPQTLAKRILFDSNKTAIGVVAQRAGRTFTLSARNEVILSAGAFRSPQMLMVSGIGPRGLLEKYDIPVVAERPGVGQNMWDHVLFGPTYQLNVLTHSSLANETYSAEAAALYTLNGTGMLTNIGSNMLAWEKLPDKLRSNLSPATRAALAADFPADWPELEFLMIDGWLGDQRDTVLGGPHDSKQYGGIAVALISPFSRGAVTIRSADTEDHPIVDPNWLGDPRDQEIAVQMYRRAREVFNASSIQPALVGSEAYPGLKYSTDAELLDVIRRSSSTVHHASATCAMGRQNDSMAVVDSHARVIGVQGLRVVDASAMPFLPPGHPQSTIYALAEKIAALILEE